MPYLGFDFKFFLDYIDIKGTYITHAGSFKMVINLSKGNSRLVALH